MVHHAVTTERQGKHGKEVILLERFRHITRNKRMTLDSVYAFLARIAQKLCVLIASYEKANDVNLCYGL